MTTDELLAKTALTKELAEAEDRANRFATKEMHTERSLNQALARLGAVERENARLREALTKLVALDDNYSPFGGEIYQDRIHRRMEPPRRPAPDRDEGGRVMTDPTTIKRRIEACVMQAQTNARNHGGDNATAAADLMCAFVLIAMKSGADPERALAAMWENAKICVSDFWPDGRVN